MATATKEIELKVPENFLMEMLKAMPAEMLTPAIRMAVKESGLEGKAIAQEIASGKRDMRDLANELTDTNVAGERMEMILEVCKSIQADKYPDIKKVAEFLVKLNKKLFSLYSDESEGVPAAMQQLFKKIAMEVPVDATLPFSVNIHVHVLGMVRKMAHERFVRLTDSGNKYKLPFGYAKSLALTAISSATSSEELAIAAMSVNVMSKVSQDPIKRSAPTPEESEEEVPKKRRKKVASKYTNDDAGKVAELKKMMTVPV